MEITPDDDQVEPSEETGIDTGSDPGFGEQEEAAQEEEWAEDAEEGGVSEL